MTPEQEKDLFVEWGLYEPRAKRAMIEEYIFTSEGELSREAFLEYLKVKLEIEGYWQKVGLA
jgi:hypothetical protein